MKIHRILFVIALFSHYFSVAQSYSNFLKNIKTSQSFISLFDFVEGNDGSLYFLSNKLVKVNNQSNSWSTTLFKTNSSGQLVKEQTLFSTDTFSIFQNIFIKHDSIILFGRIHDGMQYFLATAYYDMNLTAIGKLHVFPLGLADSNQFIYHLNVRENDDHSLFYGSGTIDSANSKINFPLLSPLYVEYDNNGLVKGMQHNNSYLKASQGISKGVYSNELFQINQKKMGRLPQYYVWDFGGGIFERPNVPNTKHIYTYDNNYQITDTIILSYTDSISKPEIGQYTRRWCYMNQPIYFGSSFNVFKKNVLLVAAGDSGNCNSCSSSGYFSSSFMQLIILDSTGKLFDKRSIAKEGYKECGSNIYHLPIVPAVYNGMSISNAGIIYLGGYTSLNFDKEESERPDGQVDRFVNEIVIAAFDSNYNLKWKRFIGNDYLYTLLTVKATNDGGVLALCSRYDTANFYSSDLYKRVQTDVFAIKFNNAGIITSVIDLNKENSILKTVAYPNPGNDFVLFKYLPTQKGTIELFDLEGRICLKSEILNDYPLPTNMLKHGLYIYRITDSDGMFVTSGKWFKE